MAGFECRNLTFRYPGLEDIATAIDGVSLSVASGDFVVVCGPSGSGKSTLLRLLKREISPGGTLAGDILLGGRPVQDWPAREAAMTVGFVGQNPDNQLVVDTVEHELAFGMENFGTDGGAMRRRMAEIAGFFGLEPLLSRRTDTLSGGQKQTVNLAAVLMLQPKVLLLDEPLAQLDPLAARELLGMIKRLNDEWGITVVLSEHRIDDLLPLADKVVRLEQGKIVFDGSPRAFAKAAWERGNGSWLSALPAVTRFALEQKAAFEGEPPLTVKEARAALSKAASLSPFADHTPNPAPATAQASLLSANGLFFAYDAKSAAVMRGLDWEIREGDWTALFGGNGSGKSTLLQLLAGLRKPLRGDVRLGADRVPLKKVPADRRYARIGYLAQNPILHFVHETLREDLLHAARRASDECADAAEVARQAERFGIAHLLDRHPHDLSGGEQQLGALAMLLFGRPELLLLDEPTKGLDPEAKRRLANHLSQAHAEGTTLLLATHDVEFAASHATRCALLFQGDIVADEAPERFFEGNLFYATALHRLKASSAAAEKEVPLP